MASNNPNEEEVEETTPQEEQPDQHQEESQEEPAQEEQPEEQEDPEEETEEGSPEELPSAQDPANGESAELRRQLLQARGQIAAYAAGVAPAMVEDAVTLAMAEASKGGEVTESSVAKAMETVLKRHPEWKQNASDKTKGGFRLGADRDATSNTGRTGNVSQNTKRWNRFK